MMFSIVTLNVCCGYILRVFINAIQSIMPLNVVVMLISNLSCQYIMNVKENIRTFFSKITVNMEKNGIILI